MFRRVQVSPSATELRPNLCSDSPVASANSSSTAFPENCEEEENSSECSVLPGQTAVRSSLLATTEEAGGTRFPQVSLSWWR